MNFLENYNEIELDNKVTPLICAVYFGKYDVVKLLLENVSLDADQASDETG